jgi:hypothetical protein
MITLLPCYADILFTGCVCGGGVIPLVLSAGITSVQLSNKLVKKTGVRIQETFGSVYSAELEGA